MYIFCEFIWYVLLFNVLSIFIDIYARVLGSAVLRWTFLYKTSSLGQFVMKLSSNTHMKHIFGFWPLRFVRLLL